MRRSALLGLCLLALAALLAAAAAGGSGAHRLRVGLVLETVGPEDPFGGVTYAGFKRAVRDFGVEGRALTQGPREDAFTEFAYLARRRYDLVIGLGIVQAVALDRAAHTYPRTRFAIVDTPWERLPHRPPNARGTAYRVEEAAYLAGYLAELMEERRPGKDVVSAVGGYHVPTVDPFIAGFRAGARRANPHVVVLVDYANEFVDPAKCKRVALSQIAKGSGVVFPVAGNCGLGALEAAKEQGVFGIGVDSDQSELGPHILTSVVKRMDLAVYQLVRDLVHGTFRPGRSAVYDLGDGGVGLGRISPKVPRVLLARVDRLRATIVDGKVGPIPTTVSQPLPRAPRR